MVRPPVTTEAPPMMSPRPILCVFVALLLTGAGAVGVAQTKPRIDKAADLPRFTYAIDGKVEDVVRSAQKFAPFAAALRRNTSRCWPTTTSPTRARAAA